MPSVTVSWERTALLSRGQQLISLFPLWVHGRELCFMPQSSLESDQVPTEPCCSCTRKANPLFWEVSRGELLRYLVHRTDENISNERLLAPGDCCGDGLLNERGRGEGFFCFTKTLDTSWWYCRFQFQMLYSAFEMWEFLPHTVLVCIFRNLECCTPNMHLNCWVPWSQSWAWQ